MKKTVGIMMAAAIALAGTEARAADAQAIAEAYTNQYKELAANNGGKGAVFEQFCRMARESFNLSYMTRSVRNWAGLRDFEQLSDGLALGYLLAYSLEKQAFFAEARADLANLRYVHIAIEDGANANVRNAKKVRFRVRPTGDENIMLVDASGKIADIGNTQGMLLHASGAELQGGSGMSKLVSKIESVVGSRYKNGCP